MEPRKARREIVRCKLEFHVWRPVLTVGLVVTSLVMTSRVVPQRGETHGHATASRPPTEASELCGRVTTNSSGKWCVWTVGTGLVGVGLRACVVGNWSGSPVNLSISLQGRPDDVVRGSSHNDLERLRSNYDPAATPK